MPDPLLTTRAPRKGAVRGVALLLHGGRQLDERPVQRQHASWWRMALVAGALARAAVPEQVAVVLLRYRARGWNADPATDPAPVLDGRWAMARLRERYGEVPVVLVGHSMGGRAACALAADDRVAGVVALAPWLPADEPVGPARRQRVVLAHGQMDRWTSAGGSLDWARRARAAGARVARYEIGPVGHFMFSRVGQWNGLARDTTLGMLATRPLPVAVSAAFGMNNDDGLRLAPTW